MAAPARSTAYEFEWAPTPSTSRFFRPPSRIPTEFSPPLIAMVAVIVTAALIVLLRRLRGRFRRWRRRRNLLSASFSGDPFDSPPATFSSSDQYFFSPYYGLDEPSIKSLPLSLYSKSRSKLLEASGRECSVCLIDFADGDQLRSLPLCSHAFHVDCIDAWLRSHATCPLCRSGVFIPVRAARIRPSLDDLMLDPPPNPPPEPEISAASPPPDRDFLLKRSYSFGFERNFAADSSMASPWRYRQQRGFWSKRWPSPFGVAGGSRVFSFRSYRGGVSAGKSPFGKRRGFFPSLSNGGGGVGPSWRRSRAMTSPSAVFMRSVMAVGPAVTGFSSSRMRCGDPEALLSPDRFGGRRSDYRWGGGR